MGFYSYGFYFSGLNPPPAPCGPWASSVWGGFLTPYIWPGTTGAAQSFDIFHAIGQRASADPVLGPMLPNGIASVFTGTLPPRMTLPAISLIDIGSSSTRSTSPISYIQDRTFQVTFLASTAAGALAFLRPWEACFRPQMVPLQFAGGALLGMFIQSDALTDSDTLGVTGTNSTRVYMLVCTFLAKVQRNLPS
jgi:hypothetical protein